MTERYSRRQYLALNWESTVGFLGNFFAPQIEIERDFIRPPGACGEFEFITSCTRCGKCKEICPEQTIHLFTLHDGAKLVNTPFLKLNESPCTFCLKCMDVCPTDALSREAYQMNAQLGYVKVEPANCLAHKNVMCDYCVRSCPVDGAMKIENGVPIVSKQDCTGCGQCISSCIAEGIALLIRLKEHA
jgi:ferredoxin-type protein NapG